MGIFSLLPKLPNVTGTACAVELSLTNNASSLLAQACQKFGAAGELGPVISFNDLPAQVQPELKKQIAEFSKPKGLLSNYLPSSWIDKAESITNEMKPSLQSGLGFDGKTINSFARSNLFFDPAMPENLTIYVHPLGQSAGFSLRLKTEDIEMEFGIHVHAPAE